MADRRGAAATPVLTAGALRRRRVLRYRGLLILLAPAVLWFLVFEYYPMYGAVVAFKDYRILDGILASPWAGLDHFQKLFDSARFWAILRNTMMISLYKLIFGFPAPILLALLLNEVQRVVFKRTVQTISYLPHFISWVVIGGIVRDLLSPTHGVINFALGLVGIEPINFLIRPELFRGIVVIGNIWKEVGWGSIIYLAAISGIDPQLYEAAVMDGAGRMRQAASITLPSIMGVVVILLILRVGNIMDAGFEEIFNLYNPVVYSTGDIIDTYVYRVGLEQFDYSYSTAIGLFKNVVGLVLLVGTNLFVRRVSEHGIW